MEREFFCQIEYFCSDRHNCSDMKEEIIRCRDCKHYKENMKDQFRYRCKRMNLPAKPDGFCAWAERVD